MCKACQRERFWRRVVLGSMAAGVFTLLTMAGVLIARAESEPLGAALWTAGEADRRIDVSSEGRLSANAASHTGVRG